MYGKICVTWSRISADGRVRKSLSNWFRTLLLVSRRSGRRVGRMTLTGRGNGVSTGREVMVVVRCARESRRWLSDLDDSSDR